MAFEEILARLHEDHGLTPVVAAEIEWYVRAPGGAPLAPDDPSLDALLDLLRAATPRVGLSLHSAERERGRGQLEAALNPTHDPARLAADLAKLAALVTALAEGLGRTADFAAKPFAEDYGSALHLHLHLEDGEGNNVFRRQGGRTSEPLAHAIAGLLAAFPRDLPIFAPTDASRARFVPGWHAPTTISWGANNRTTALRLPDPVRALRGHADIARRPPTDARRIEHRVAGADADPAEVIAVILDAALAGLDSRTAPPDPVHGDASDPNYGLPPLSPASSPFSSSSPFKGED